MDEADLQKTAKYGPYSPIRRAGGLFFISGQVGIDQAGKAGSGIAVQTRQALQNMAATLQQAGLTLDSVVKTTVFLTDMDHFPAMNQEYMEYFPEPRPARSCVAVAELPRVGDRPLLIEIEAVACKEAVV